MDWFNKKFNFIKDLATRKPKKKATIPKVEPKPVVKKKANTKKLTEQDFIEAAETLNCEVAAIKAVFTVESGKSGFDSKGRVKILFEAHHMYKNLKKFGINPLSIQKGNENIIQRTWSGGRKYYRQDQHARLAKAVKIHRDAALMSASWGAAQVMGSNWKVCGYPSLQAFINDAYSSAGHLRMFVGFVKGNGLGKYLKTLNWAGFAKRYNGPSYSRNKYDQKMAAAYKKFSK